MKLQALRFSEYGILFTLVVFACAYLLQLAGAFKASDQAIGDLCTQLDQSEDGRKPILLVYADPELLTNSNSRLSELLQSIQQARPAQIGIVAESQLPHSTTIKELSASNQLVVGRYAPQIHTNADLGLTQGFIDLSLNGQSIYREHQTTRCFDGSPLPSFETQIVSRISSQRKNLPRGRFGISYSGGNNSLPHVSANDFLSGKVISEMVKDQVVLIGQRMDPTYGIVTPTTRGSQRMTRLELHGHILNTLLRGDFQTKASPILTGILLALLALIVCQIARQVSTTWLPQTFFVCAALILLGSLVNQSYNSIQVPTSAMLFCLTLGFATASLRRFRILQVAAKYWRLMMDLEQKESNSKPEKSWELLTDAVSQMFCPSRMVLMELKPNETHLKIVSSIHCDANDIFEKRRDAQRSPYRNAIEAERPIAGGVRYFFEQNSMHDEVEFMVPLIFSAQVLGFMVISMERSALENWKDFENFLTQFANDMSMVLADQRTSEQSNSYGSLGLPRLRSLPEENTLAKIQSEKLEQQNRVQRLNSAFERSESASAICDIFGRILQANSRLVQLLHDLQVVTGESSCVEMISRLTARPIGDCQRMFLQAIMNNRTNQIGIPPTVDRPYPCIMFVKPLMCKTQQSSGDINYRRVVIEIIEGRAFENITKWQQRLSQDISETADRQMERLQTQLQRLQTQSQELSASKTTIQSLGDSMDELRNTLSRFQIVTQNHLTEQPKNCFPVNALEIYQSAFENHQQLLESRGIEVVHDFDQDNCLGMANPFLLEKTFAAILDLIAQNAFDRSQMFVSATVIDDKTHFQFRNRGGGTPLQGLRKSLIHVEDSGNDTTSQLEQTNVFAQEQLDRLNEIREWLETWDGSLRIANMADYSLNIELTLTSASNGYPISSSPVRKPLAPKPNQKHV